MKTKFILLCTFLLCFCYLARGQSEIDTSYFLNQIQESHEALDAIISHELSKDQNLKIELLGNESCVITKQIEQTLLPILNSKSNNRLTFQLIYLDYTPPNKKTLLKNGTWSIPANVQHPSLGHKKHTSATLLINGVEVFDYIYSDQEKELAKTEGCSCNFFRCFSHCTGLSYSAIALASLSCGAACATCAGTEGIAYAACITCGSCIMGGVSVGGSCALYCAHDNCYSYPCTPGSIAPNAAYDCSTGIRRVQVCNCEGTAYDDWAPAPCPTGTSYGSNCECTGPCLQGFRDEGTDEKGSEKGGMNDDGISNIDCPEILIDSEVNHESIPGAQNGSISLIATNGIPSYTFSWADGATGANRANLSAGIYCVTVSDVICCASSKCFTIITEACENLEWNLAFEMTPACNGNDGAVSVEVLSGGLAPYSYTWSNGQNGSMIENLEANGYVVTVSDANGCTATDVVIVNGVNDEYPTELSGIVTNICSDGSSNKGAINLILSGLTQATSYQWSNGETTQDIDNLELGSYGVTVIDDCENEYTADFVINNVFATSSSTPTAFGVCGGSIYTTIVNGTAPYTYEINGPERSSTITLNATALTFGGLCAGDFTIAITDANGCTITITETVIGCPAPVYGAWYYNASSAQFCRPFNIPGSGVCEPEDGELCFTPIYGEWAKTGDQYCRTVDCPEGAYCDDFSTSGLTPECFTPIYGDWYFQFEWGGYCKDVFCTGAYYCSTLDIQPECGEAVIQNCEVIDNYSMCHCEIWANGEFTGFYEDVPPGEEYLYDNGVCTVNYICDGSIAATNTIDPTFTYSYEIDNDGKIICTKNIFCDGSQVDTEDFEPEIEYDYDPDDNKCLRIFSCDGMEYHTVKSEPEEYEDWTFDEGDLACSRAVICFDREDNDWINRDENPDIDWTFDEDDRVCIAYVTCEDANDDIETIGDTDIDWVDFNEDTFNCIAEVTCSFDGEEEEEFDLTDGAETDLAGVGLVDGEFRCLMSYDCGDGALTGSAPGDLATCSPDPNNSSHCLFTCGSFSASHPCIPAQCGPSPGFGFGRNDSSEEQEKTTTASVLVYPNPFTEKIHINTLPTDRGQLTIDVVDGRGIAIKSIQSNQEESLIIDTSKFNRGIYYLKIYNKEYSFFELKRMIKLY